MSGHNALFRPFLHHFHSLIVGDMAVKWQTRFLMAAITDESVALAAKGTFSNSILVLPHNTATVHTGVSLCLEYLAFTSQRRIEPHRPRHIFGNAGRSPMVDHQVAFFHNHA